MLESLPEGAAGTDGIEPLMRFIPPFVRQRCLEGISVPAENRTVSVLFLVADMQVFIYPMIMFEGPRGSLFVHSAMNLEERDILTRS